MMGGSRLLGLESIRQVFAKTSAARRSAFLPYFPIGYPDYETSLDIIEGMARAGVDAFEIGMPFSDPLADGPVIQAATSTALANGVNTRRCLEAVGELRHRGVEQPLLLMGYLNPILSYGVAEFAADARAFGADGLIVPDLPPEETAILSTPCARHDLAMVQFVTPNSDEARIAAADENATGFIYVVSLKGTTGARESVSEGLADLLGRLRGQTDKPLVVGFGIGSPEHARAINGLCDGFIVGSALVNAARIPGDAQRLAEDIMGALVE